MKKIIVSFFVCALALQIEAQTFVNENFNSGLPGGWAVVDGGTPSTGTWMTIGSGGWDPFVTGTPWYVVSPTGFMVIKSAASTQQNDDELVTPAFNSSGTTSLILQFDQVFENQTTTNGFDHGYVEVFDGSSWQQVANMNADLGNFFGQTNDHQSINILAHANANMKVRFRYINGGLSSKWWGIDNVTIIGVAGTNPPVAQFTANSTSVCTGETVTFTDQSTNGPTSWNWSFLPSSGITYVNSTNANSQNPQIQFANQGNYHVTLNATNSFGSDTETKSFYINVATMPTVNAGGNQTFCANNISNVPLSGSISGSATGVNWTTSGTGSFSNSSILTCTYSPSAADKTSGLVTITLTTTGGCSIINDSITISLTSPPTADAGMDQSICEDTSVTLNGSITVATGGSWTTSGSGTFSNSSSLNSTYTPSANDVSVFGNVTLTFTTTGNGNCAAESDDVVIDFDRKALVNAGGDIVVCKDSVLIISGIVQIATGGIWTSSGTGSFTIDNILITEYIPSAADNSGSDVDLILTSTGNGTCSSVMDTLTVSIVDTCVDVTIGMQDESLGIINVFPNPVIDDVIFIDLNKIESENDIELTILNILGEKIMSRRLTNNYRNKLMLENRAKGIYFLRINSKGKLLYNEKIILK